MIANKYIRMDEATYERVVEQARASNIPLRAALERIVALGAPLFAEKERPYRASDTTT